MAETAEYLQESLLGLDDDTLLAILGNVLAVKPDLARSLVNLCVPALTYPPSKAYTHKRPRGIVKSLNSQSGSGFIECPELKAKFGNDVFLHARQAGKLQVGASVSFAVSLSNDYKPQAYDVLAEDGNVQAAQSFGAPKGSPQLQNFAAAFPGLALGQLFGNGKGGGMMAMGGAQARPTADMGRPSKGMDLTGGMLGQFKGVVKSHNPKTYGFVDCPQLKMMGYNDVFVHHEQMKDFVVGSQVSFVAFLNAKGQPQGKDLTTAAGGAMRALARPTQKAMISPTALALQGFGMGAISEMRPSKGMDESGGELGEFQGTVKSNNPKTYGFIECQDLKEMGYNDVFVHHEQMKDFAKGTEVSFTAFLNAKGQPQAKDLTVSGVPSKKRKFG